MLPSMLHILRISWVCNYIYGVLKPYLPNNPNTKPLLMPDSPVPPHFPSPPSAVSLSRPTGPASARSPGAPAPSDRLPVSPGPPARLPLLAPLGTPDAGDSSRSVRSGRARDSDRRFRPGWVATAAGEGYDLGRGGERPHPGRVTTSAGEGCGRGRGGSRPRPGRVTTAAWDACDRARAGLRPRAQGLARDVHRRL